MRSEIHVLEDNAAIIHKSRRISKRSADVWRRVSSIKINVNFHQIGLYPEKKLLLERLRMRTCLQSGDPHFYNRFRP